MTVEEEQGYLTLDTRVFQIINLKSKTTNMWKVSSNFEVLI